MNAPPGWNARARQPAQVSVEARNTRVRTVQAAAHSADENQLTLKP